MKPSILLIDSGMGGVSIYNAVRQSLPNAHYLYCFDNAFFPYSEKPEALLTERAIRIVQKIAEIYPLDLVVVACNTASTVVLPAMRAQFDFPVVGVVPAIKPAAEISDTKTIGLLATKGTIVRPYTLDLIEKYAAHCVVEKNGTTILAEIAEEKLKGNPVDMAQLLEVVKMWQDYPTLDTVILGCTHYPLVKEELQQCLPKVKYFVDSGAAIAKRVASLLAEGQLQLHPENRRNLAFCTKLPEDLAVREKMMQQIGFESLQVLDV